jgi:uncharacterized protein
MAAQMLKAQITEAMKTALKGRDKARLGAIRLILADINRVEVDERRELDDNEVLAILDRMCKQRRESIRQYRDAGRDDLAERESAEIDVIRSFLPEPLDDAAITRLIDEAIAETGADSVRAMGQVMAVLKPKLQGRADLGAVSQQVKARLQSPG